MLGGGSKYEREGAQIVFQSHVDTHYKFRYSFGFLHVKAVDDAGHDRNVKLKVVSLQEPCIQYTR